MAYTHLTKNELAMIETYFLQPLTVKDIAKRMNRARQTIYNVINFLREGHNALDYYARYTKNKQQCGRHQTVLSQIQRTYIQEKVTAGWNPEIIIGRSAMVLPCCSRTLYRLFERGEFDVTTLPMKGKRKPNGHKEKRGKQTFTRSIHTRTQSYPNYAQEFGHLEGDTIVGIHHKSAIITLVERLSKVIITLKPEGRKASDIEKAIVNWSETIPKHTFKSITFDCGKEFSNWKGICNQTDLAIYFADPGTPSQRGLNEHSNGLLRRDGLPKSMDFNTVDQSFVSSIANRRNHIPRKSLGFKTPFEVFMSYINQTVLSSLI